MDRASDFFAFARERHAIYLRRQAGQSWPWTEDGILQSYRFTNVFRELDATTQWFRQWVRDPLRASPDVLLATVVFRWFNRVSSGEALFRQLHTNAEGFARTPFEHLAAGDGTDTLAHALSTWNKKGPHVTGAYIIKTPDGLDKMHGVLWCIEQFMALEQPFVEDHELADTYRVGFAEMARVCLAYPGRVSLEAVWEWLRQFPYLGPFSAYEIVTDLRHTALLDQAPDIMTWANPGPGARRGLNRLHGRALEENTPRKQLIEEMRQLLALSQKPEYWPQVYRGGRDGDEMWWDTQGYLLDEACSAGTWPTWEMRDVEHTLCEMDKFERVRLGQGKPRGVYKPR